MSIVLLPKQPCTGGRQRRHWEATHRKRTLCVAACTKTEMHSLQGMRCCTPKNSQRNLRGKREIQQVILKSIKIAYICLLMQPAHSQGRRHISRKKRLNMMVVPRAVLRVQGRNCQ